MMNKKILTILGISIIGIILIGNILLGCFGITGETNLSKNVFASPQIVRHIFTHRKCS
ncbi:hypothetical protein ES703_00919 [subsurface metagenome]